MSRLHLSAGALAICALVLCADTVGAEPMFLSKSESRCTTCHYSPTGGGLLTPYGRLQSRQELSTTSGDSEQFLWGALKNTLGPVNLGIDIRPSHLHVSFPGGSDNRGILMNADLIGAVQAAGWTFYGEVGRRPESLGGDVYSYEYWISKQLSSEWGLRGGRFFPAYGIRFADHTSYNRASLLFDKYDQIYGVELSHTTRRSLVQIAAGPGRADLVLDDEGKNDATVSGRVQFDLNSRNVLVGSGIFRNESATEVENSAAGVAYGFSPWSRLTIWTQADAKMRDEDNGNSFVFTNETSLEALRGIWLKVSPQVQTESGATPGFLRWKFEANALPRTHWNVVVSYYHDKNRKSGLVSHIVLTQLHVYL